MARATLTSKGQVTIPVEVRRALGVEAGDRLLFRVREDGVVEVVAETGDLTSLHGALEPRKRGVTLDDMERAIRRGGARR
jgi:AbrB family looped-hinge helix DNA binding protein